MSLQFDEDEDDMFDEDEQDEGEGLASDQPKVSKPKPQTLAQVAAQHRPQSMAQAAASRRMRVRPMTPAMMQKNPQVVSIILTRVDGKQLVFIRK